MFGKIKTPSLLKFDGGSKMKKMLIFLSLLVLFFHLWYESLHGAVGIFPTAT